MGERGEIGTAASICGVVVVHCRAVGSSKWDLRGENNRSNETTFGLPGRGSTWGCKNGLPTIFCLVGGAEMRRLGSLRRASSLISAQGELAGINIGNA